MKYTREQLLAHLRDYWEEHNQPPPSKRFHISEGVYRNAFGSWNAALKEANVPTRKEWCIDKNTRDCKHCGESFYSNVPTQTFCSQSCNATYNNIARGKRQAGKNLDGTPREVKHCLNCEAELKTTSLTFCGFGCGGEYKRKRTIEKWLAGEISGNHGKKVQLGKNIRSYLLEEAGHKCSQCGWGEQHPDDGRVPLEVDHIDGDASNSRPENLRVLCPNCHSLTSSYKSRNIGGSKRVYK